MTSHEWYVRGDGNVRGPLSGRELRTWARDGRVTPATDVGPSATGPWRKADRVRGLFAAAAEVPAAPPGDPADRAWYVGREGAVYGPFTARELQAMAAHGQLTSTDFVRREGERDWVFSSGLPWLNPPDPVPPLAVPAGVIPPMGIGPPDGLRPPPGVRPPESIPVPKGLQVPPSIPVGGSRRPQVPPVPPVPPPPQGQWPPFARPSEVDGVEGWAWSATGRRAETEAWGQVLRDMVLYAVGIVLCLAFVGWLAGFLRFYLYLLGVGLGFSLALLALWDGFQYLLTGDYRTGLVFFFKRVVRVTFPARQEFYANAAEAIQAHVTARRPGEVVVCHVFEEPSAQDWAIVVYSPAWVGVVRLDADTAEWVAPGRPTRARAEEHPADSPPDGRELGGASLAPYRRRVTFDKVLYIAVDVPAEDVDSFTAVKKVADRYAKQHWVVLATADGPALIHFGRDPAAARNVAQVLRAGAAAATV